MLSHKITGNGPPLLLIHGWGVSYTIWRNLVPLLEEHFKLIIIELPGIGDSPALASTLLYYPASAEEIERLRQELNIEQWAILSYSVGTRVGEAYIQRYPDRVTRAVFLCPLYLPWWSSLGLRFARWLEKLSPGLMYWILSGWRLRRLILLLGFSGQPHAYADEWQKEIELQQKDSIKRQLYQLPGLGRVPFAMLTETSLFVWGHQDVLTARPRQPRSNDVFIPAHHGAPMLAAQYVAEKVIPFLLAPRQPDPP